MPVFALVVCTCFIRSKWNCCWLWLVIRVIRGFSITNSTQQIFSLCKITCENIHYMFVSLLFLYVYMHVPERVNTHLCIHSQWKASLLASGMHYMFMEPCGGQMSLKVAGAVFPTLHFISKVSTPHQPCHLDWPNDIATYWVRWPFVVFLGLYYILNYPSTRSCWPRCSLRVFSRLGNKNWFYWFIYSIKKEVQDFEKGQFERKKSLLPVLQCTSNTVQPTAELVYVVLVCDVFLI